MKEVLLIGAARSGIAAARLLAREGYHVVLTDMKPVDQKEELIHAGIEVYDNGHPEFLKERDYEFIVKNPGIPYRAPLVAWFLEKGVPIYTEIETAFRAGKYVDYGAVTGTDGKTTITTLLYEMLKADPEIENPRVAGNIGIPLSEVILELDGKPATVALELSNFQLLGTETFKPKVSTISNLAPDHLDYMDSLDAYYRSKFKIFENCDESDYFILNMDDPTIVDLADNMFIPCQVITFSLSDPNALLHLSKEGKAMLGDMELFDSKDLKLVGQFNLGNAMMAACQAYLLGADLNAIEKVISEFPGVEHRIEYVDTINGVRIYNDSKATNTHSASAALSSFEGNVRLLAGGKDKGIDYSVLKEFDDRVVRCYSFGQIRDVFTEIFSDTKTQETMEEALDAALADAKEGDVILLCPATSSFDQFKNYEVRGEIFKDLVRKRKSESEHK